MVFDTPPAAQHLVRAPAVALSGGGQKIDETMSDKIVNDLTAYMRGIVAKKGRNSEWAERAVRESVSVTAKEALEMKVIGYDPFLSAEAVKHAQEGALARVAVGALAGGLEFVCSV